MILVLDLHSGKLYLLITEYLKRESQKRSTLKHTGTFSKSVSRLHKHGVGCSIPVPCGFSILLPSANVCGNLISPFVPNPYLHWELSISFPF